MSETRGTVDVLDDLIADLRSYQPLVDILPDSEAIYHGHPTDDRGYGAEVTITVIYDGSENHRGVTERNYRFQVTVASTYAWREARDDEGVGGLPRMMEIMDCVADRCDGMDGLKEVGLGGEGGPAPQKLEGPGNRLGLIADWRADGFERDADDGRIGSS